MINTISLLLGNSTKSVSNWKKEKRPIMTFLYKYFSKEELEEFLNTGKINKFDNFQTTLESSCIGFLTKLRLLDNREFSGYSTFISFIGFYIKIKLGIGDNKDTIYFQKSELVTHEQKDELTIFQNLFIKFILDLYETSNKEYTYDLNIGTLSELKYLFNFINSFTESELIFLNMNIDDDFRPLLSFKNSNYYNAKRYVESFEYPMLDYFEKELDKKGNLEDLISDYKSKCIKELEEN